ncbi:MAG: hypothetical protein V2I43_22785 [Parvularcula sp.]|jgi:hypothetical protein|nr:hypothetical protein [Parvularcula sp.]
MILHDPDAEKPFEAAFDARFPYESASASTLIRQGWAISLNAAFCVLDELCRPPLSCSVSQKRLRDLMSEWAAGPDHPLKAPVLQAAHALIDATPLDWRDGVELMKKVASYDGQRAALSIVYFASDSDSPEGDAALTDTDTQIRAQWEAKGVCGRQPISVRPSLTSGDGQLLSACSAFGLA